MKYFKAVLLCALFINVIAAQAQQTYSWKTGSSGGYNYRYVTNDPLNTRYYTLKNGLTVILSQNSKEPHMVFRMAVRAGSNTDPKANTGLAHYLEHLLFKGTDHFGTLNYSKEKPLLDQITALYETYRRTSDETSRKAIYKKIDSVSGMASNYAIANEYDKMMKSIGSSSTNAYTSTERTVYIEDFPSNALDKFMAVQGERFRLPVFRLFHTELEVVYEEKNRTLDDESAQMYQRMMSALFPTHNYGQQTTIGNIGDLKNPSLIEIKKYYDKYYVPNNMAVIIAGDFNYDELIRKIDHTFAYMVKKPIAQYNPAPEVKLTKSKTIDIFGPGTENLYIGYRGTAQNTHESLLLRLITHLLANGKAGLIDINLNQKQQMLRANAGYTQMKDYGVFVLTGTPKEGQTLKQAEHLLLGQIDRIKKGDFDKSLISATVANMKFSDLEDFDNNDTRADDLVDAFVLNRGEHWDKMLNVTNAMLNISKQEIVAFANRFFTDNYVAVLKHNGENDSTIKIKKPEITAVATNANELSAFAKRIIEEPVKPIAPKFLDYNKDLTLTKAGIAEIISVKNTENELFRMTYQFDLGSNNNKLLSYATQYLAYLGTDKYSAEMINRLFYNMACSYSIYVGPEQTVISISGLQENFDKAISLLEYVLLNCKINEQALTDLKSQVLKYRNNAQLNKNQIMSGLETYAQYGADNPFNYGLTNTEINDLKSADLVQMIHNLNQYKHIITYYGPSTAESFSAEITKLHQLPDHFRETPVMKKFTYTKISTPKIYYANYEMVQTEINWIHNIATYNPADAATIFTFNNYFGDGMGSIVSQTIRESRALAYSTFAMVWVPDSREKQISTIAYVGCQADKMNDAIFAMNNLLTTLPVSEAAFKLSKASVINNLETSRYNKAGIIQAYLSDKKLGYNYDSRKEQYAAVKSLRLEDILNFYKQYISGQPYNYCILGSEKNVNPAELEKLGSVTKLSLKQIFGY